MAAAFASWNRPDVRYVQVATLDIFWRDLYRPELFLRTFQPVEQFDQRTEAIYIFKRVVPDAF